MPRPKYILCASSVSQDSTTNLFSFFHVLEGFNVSVGQTPPIPAPLQFTGIAVWERTEDDTPENDLEFELTIKFPGEEPRQIQTGQFRMEKRNHRFKATVVAEGLPSSQSGDIVFASKVKPSGSDNWLSQEFTIPVEVISDTTTDEQTS